MKKFFACFKSGNHVEFELPAKDAEEILLAITKADKPIQFILTSDIIINSAELEYIEIVPG